MYANEHVLTMSSMALLIRAPNPSIAELRCSIQSLKTLISNIGAMSHRHNVTLLGSTSFFTNGASQAHLCGAPSSTTRGVCHSARAGFLGALLPLFPLCCLYLFVLLLNQPDQGITPPCQLLNRDW